MPNIVPKPSKHSEHNQTARKSNLECFCGILRGRRCWNNGTENSKSGVVYKRQVRLLSALYANSELGWKHRGNEICNPSSLTRFRAAGNRQSVGSLPEGDTRIFSPATGAGLCDTIGCYLYLFKRLTPVCSPSFSRFEHISANSSGKVLAK